MSYLSAERVSRENAIIKDERFHRVLGRITLRRLATIVCAVGLLLIAASWIHRRSTQSAVPSRGFASEGERMDEWRALGGSWEIRQGVVSNRSDERGAKLLTGSTEWRDYTFRADIRVAKEQGDVGLVVRSDNEIRGLDTYNGYYVGLRSLDGTIIIGRSGYGWFEARPVPMPGGLHASSWYRVRVTAYGCSIAASVQNLTTQQVGWIAFEERPCLRAGRVGLRSVDTGGMWRNIAISAATRADYLDLQQHAASVERPMVFIGPPWWTPWHVGMLFAGALGFALFTQLIYFRIQQWKTFTIMQERERLAHQIHDTMAQSFAGVGYQLQGIRRSVLRADHQDSRSIAQQLGVAYQLVRRCHEEASTTISVLSAPSPSIQRNLLQTLAETAHRIAGDQIRTSTRVKGDSVPLNLPLANALLHIGQEAIANAISHSELTLLTITLAYEGKCVELVIEDNGKGFTPMQESRGLGILGMQKRARDIAGTLSILSTPGAGTQVCVRTSVHQGTMRGSMIAVFKKRFVSSPI